MTGAECIKLPTIAKYRELIPAYPDSMVKFFSKEEYKNQRTIINYLKNAEDVMYYPMYWHDVYTNEPIDIPACEMSDGEYRWPSVLVYYVEKYNLMLPEDFINHVMKNTDREKERNTP